MVAWQSPPCCTWREVSSVPLWSSSGYWSGRKRKPAAMVTPSGWSLSQPSFQNRHLFVFTLVTDSRDRDTSGFRAQFPDLGGNNSNVYHMVNWRQNLKDFSAQLTSNHSFQQGETEAWLEHQRNPKD
ncbi:uncharacterized protein RHO17_004011 isoform 1-T1 [Thomomys bottae]